MQDELVMRKQSLNSKGFGLVGVLIVVLVLVVVGGAGVYVYHRNHKTKAPASSSVNSSNQTSKNNTSNTTAKTDPYAGWKTYANAQVSFKYPSDWTATMGRGQSRVADATSPAFTSSAVNTANNPGAPVYLYLQLSTDGLTIDCADAPCQVAAVTPLSNPQLPGAVLALVSQTSGNGTEFTEYVVARGGAKVGDTSIDAVKTGSDNAYIFGQPYYSPKDGGLTMAARITDLATFQADSHVKDLVNLINSISFN